MDTTAYRHQEAVTIDRSPEELYDLIADVSRMGRWSPICTGGSYDEDGEWFAGTNAMGDATWETRCRVVVAERGASSPSSTTDSKGASRWCAGASVRPVAGGGTEVVQTWEVLPAYADGLGVDEAAQWPCST